MTIIKKLKILLAVLLLATINGVADTALDHELLVLFSDMHITASEKHTWQRAGLERCIQEVLAMNPRPANVITYGDISISVGKTEDYVKFKEIMQPLTDAGIKWKLCTGNHDRRATLNEVFPEVDLAKSPVPGRYVSVIETPHIDFIVLDSTLEGPVPGGLDDAQIKWLTEEVGKRAKPFFVGAHHPIHETKIASILQKTPLCKGYIYGHAHRWQQENVENVATLCLPSTGHWGDIGYVVVKTSSKEVVFTLVQHDHYKPRPVVPPDKPKPEWLKRTAENNGKQWQVKF